MVTIRGTGANALLLRSDAEVHRIAVTGTGNAIGITSGNVRLEEIRVHGAGAIGIAVSRPIGGSTIDLKLRASLIEASGDTGLALVSANASVEATVIRDNLGRGIHAQTDPTTKVPCELTVRDSILDRNRITGLLVVGSRASIEATLVRATRARGTDKSSGRGIAAQPTIAARLPAEITVKGSIVDGNQDLGIFVGGSKATVEDTVVRNTQPAPDQASGRGISVQPEPDSKLEAELTLRRSSLSENHEYGLYVAGAKATVEASIVRDTQPHAKTKSGGRGISVQSEPLLSRPSELLVIGSLVEKNRETAIFLGASRATIQSSIVRDTGPRARDAHFGRGIGVEPDPTKTVSSELLLQNTLIERAHDAGVFIAGSKATLEGVWVRDTRADEGSGKFGDGVVVTWFGVPSSLAIAGSFIDGSARAGISAFGASLSIDRTRLLCSQFDIDVEPYEGQAFVITDVGGNKCGCDAARTSCRAVSAGLEPIPPVEG